MSVTEDFLMRSKPSYTCRESTYWWNQDLPTCYPFQSSQLCLAHLLILLALEQKKKTNNRLWFEDTPEIP